MEHSVRWPRRTAECHKYQCGHIVAIGGSRSMPGAIALTAMAALRAGAGLVTVATPRSATSSVHSMSPCLMTCPLAEDDDGRASEFPSMAVIQRATVVALGPGCGQSEKLAGLTRTLYQEYGGLLVVDADGLNHLAGQPASFFASAGGPRIITPHLGEFRRLIDKPQLSLEDAQRLAVEWAQATKIVVVLKGPSTLVTNGSEIYWNQTGNSGMATAGCGDVLTGVIAGLWGQGLTAFEAAQTGVFWHGRAGDLAEQQLGHLSMLATDVLERLGPASLEFLNDCSTSPDRIV